MPMTQPLVSNSYLDLGAAIAISVWSYSILRLTFVLCIRSKTLCPAT